MIVQHEKLHSAKYGAKEQASVPLCMENRIYNRRFNLGNQER